MTTPHAMSDIVRRGHAAHPVHRFDSSTTLRVLGAAAALASLLGIPWCSHAQEFSANAVDAPASKGLPPPDADGAQPSARLYVAKDKLRLETVGVSGQVLVVDDENRVTTLLHPSRKSYEPLGFRPLQYFRVSDPDNACLEWLQIVGNENECRKEGEEVVGGRTTVKYAASDGANSAGAAIWVDRTLHYVVKWSDADTVAELRDIKEGPQAAELFTVPQDYQPAKPKQIRGRSRASLRK